MIVEGTRLRSADSVSGCFADCGWVDGVPSCIDYLLGPLPSRSNNVWRPKHCPLHCDILGAHKVDTSKNISDSAAAKMEYFACTC